LPGNGISNCGKSASTSEHGKSLSHPLPTVEHSFRSRFFEKSNLHLDWMGLLRRLLKPLDMITVENRFICL
jgi:hypothetical protein